VLYRGVRLLVLDEPTSLLTPQETRNLFEYLRSIAASGCGIAFVTHKLEEVMEVADRITILRQGKTVASLLKKDATTQHLAKLMIGRLPQSDSTAFNGSTAETILQLKDVHTAGGRERPSLNGVSFSLARGEVLGVAGVAGNGQRELAEAITGLRKIVHGQILCAGEPINNMGPREILRKGVGYIPQDRVGAGVIPALSIAENLILKDYDLERFSGKIFLKQKTITEFARRLIEQFGIRALDLRTPVKMLSGGNIQKVILAREISRNPRLLIAENPTRGLDIGAVETIHRMLMEQKRGGMGILLISEDLDELFKLSDRIAVLFNGDVRGVFEADRNLIDEIGLLMGGATPTENPNTKAQDTK
jgi:simple sugar transport system ATP-binding protein